MSDPIALAIDHRVDEHVRAEALYFERRSPFAKTDRFAAGLFVIVGVVKIVVDGPLGWGLLCLLVAPLLLLRRFFSVGGLVTRWRFARTAKLHETNHIVFSDAGIHFTTSSIDSKLQWSLYDGLIEDEALLLLTYGGAMYTVLPKRCFPDARAIAALRAMVEAHTANRLSPTSPAACPSPGRSSRRCPPTPHGRRVRAAPSRCLSGRSPNPSFPRQAARPTPHSGAPRCRCPRP